MTKGVHPCHYRLQDQMLFLKKLRVLRGFFPQTITLGDPYARLAVTEAVLGLFIEISFIATFPQRFFGK